MKITNLETFVVAPRWLFLKISTDEGISGWGEPVLEGHAETLAAKVKELETFLIGRDPFLIEDTWQMIYRNAAAPDPEQAHRVESLGIFYTSRDDGAEGISAFLDKRDPVFVDVASRMPPFYREWLSAT